MQCKQKWKPAPSLALVPWMPTEGEALKLGMYTQAWPQKKVDKYLFSVKKGTYSLFYQRTSILLSGFFQTNGVGVVWGVTFGKETTLFKLFFPSKWSILIRIYFENLRSHMCTHCDIVNLRSPPPRAWMKSKALTLLYKETFGNDSICMPGVSGQTNEINTNPPGV